MKMSSEYFKPSDKSDRHGVTVRTVQRYRSDGTLEPEHLTAGR
jgi:DNA-binding transcriptional MerR regulator